MLDIQELGRQKRIWKARKRREAREGTLACMEGGLIPRPPSEISESDHANGDTLEPAALYMTTVANPNGHLDGGVTCMMRLDLAGTAVTLGVGGIPSHREATVEEIAAYRKAGEDRLAERAAIGRTTDYKSDSKFGRRG